MEILAFAGMRKRGLSIYYFLIILIVMPIARRFARTARGALLKKRAPCQAWSGRRDLNSRLSVPKTDALAMLRYSPKIPKEFSALSPAMLLGRRTSNNLGR